MGIGAKKVSDHKNAFKQEISQMAPGERETFFNWFNESGGDIDTNFLKGYCDFSLHILLPCLHILKEPEKKVALEIGYGGGRLLLPASRIFQHVFGIDVHEQGELVREELKKRGCQNHTLLTSQGESIPVDPNTIDFVYSFIVLQHVERLHIFEAYLKETFRVLKNGGTALLYFGRLHTFSLNREQKILFYLDGLLDRLYPKNYLEITERVNAVNLKISLPLAISIAQKTGFTVLQTGVSKKFPNMRCYGGQRYLLLKKTDSSLSDL